MNNCISVIICTYNPNLFILVEVIKALELQSLPKDEFEIVIVDNNSTKTFALDINIDWNPQAKIVVEKKEGLNNARIRGVAEAKNELIVFIDDDNIADKYYLEECSKIAELYKNVGVFGGIANPIFFEHHPPNWITNFTGLLGCRNLGQTELISEMLDTELNQYPIFSPIGTGMCIRKEVFMKYITDSENDTFRRNLGRKGNKLTSGEDNDIVLTALKNKWQVGYFPKLIINHWIPNIRTSKSYLAKMNFEQSKCWTKLLCYNKISPWNNISKWTVNFRKLKAWFFYKVWEGNVNYIKWRGACGTFDGLAK